MISGSMELGTHGRGETQLQTTYEEGLDRCTANDIRREMFPNYALNHLTFPVPDHKPMLISTDESIMTRISRSKRFEFEACGKKEKNVLLLWRPLERKEKIII